MTEFHSDVKEVVVRVNGEEEYYRYIEDGNIDVVVNPEGSGDRPHHRPPG